jgi:hypothetical protein
MSVSIFTRESLLKDSGSSGLQVCAIGGAALFDRARQQELA